MTSEHGSDPSLSGGPIRVMHLLYKFGVGGMEVGIAKLVNGLAPSLVTSSICSCRPGDSLRERLRPGIKLFEMNRRQGNDPVLVGQLYRLFTRERPHVVHTHRWATVCEGLIAARLAGVPFVVHGEHGTLETRRHNAWVQRQVWNRVDRVLSVSSRLAERMADQIGFPLERITVIRNGVDLERFHPYDRVTARRLLGIAPDALVIGTVGRLVAVKDHATLLRALAMVRDAGVSFTGVIAGTGPLKQDTEALAASLGLPDVRLLGNRADVEHVMAAFDVFVLSSQSEGLSNTIQEAMACGLPVLATRVGGADELVEEGRTGVLMAPDDPQAMRDALLRVIRDPRLREEMGRAGRRRAESLFGLDRMIGEYLTLYLGLAGKTPHAMAEAQVREA